MQDAEPLLRVRRGEPGYPTPLERLGRSAPAEIALFGAVPLLERPLLGVFCSVRVSGGIVAPAYDAACALRDRGVGVIGGFQSPLERECLDFLMRGRQPVVVCPARGIERVRLPAGWAEAVGAGRLLLLSGAPLHRRRPDAALADARNRMVAALADRLLFLHATPGGRLRRLAAEALGWGKPVFCLDLPENSDLRVLGAVPVPAGAPAG